MTTLKHPTKAAQALPYGPLAVGMPVIANHCDCPSTKLVAVITAMDHDRKTLKYLSTYPGIKRMDGVFENITPLSAFGVVIEIPEGSDKFRCVQIHHGGACTAVYRDGRRRHWQQHYSDAVWWPYRADVLRLLDRSFVL